MKNKILYLEVLRLLAIVGVICIHVSSTFFLSYDSFSGTDKIFVVFMNSVGRFSVPVFVMISGALALSVSKQRSLSWYYSKRLGRFITPLIFWTIVYLLLGSWQGLFDADPLGGPVDAILQGQPYFHLYYLFVIIGLAVITPYLQQLWHSLTTKRKGLLTLTVLLISSFDAFIVQLWGAEYYLPVHNAVNFFVPFIGLYLLGAYLYEFNIRIQFLENMKINTIVMLVVTMLSVLVAIEMFGVKSGLFFNEYQSLNVVLYSSVLFLGVKGMEPRLQELSENAKGWLLRLSSTVFGIYLVHVLFIVALRRLILPSDVTASLPHVQLIMVAASLIASVAVVFVLQRIPLLKKTV